MKRKMDRPERADYFRVFASHMLLDEDYENLSREEIGSVFLLMLHQWSKGGSLPSDPKKLAAMAKCSEAELQSLLQRWPKIQPVEGKEGRVGIPYLIHEWNQVMAFYEDQRAKGKASAEARARTKTEEPPEEPSEPTVPALVEPLFNTGSTVADTTATDWFEKTWKAYQGLTPPPRQEGIPSSSKAACRRRWNKIVTTKKVTDQELAYCVQGYIEHRNAHHEFFQALETVIGVRKPSWEEFLPQSRQWIEEEVANRGGSDE